MEIREPLLSENAIRTLRARYLRKAPSGEALESPGQMFARVARHVASAERAFGATDRQIEETAGQFFEAMIAKEFLPNSPTLMNAGRTLGVLSACFVLPVGDSIEEIFDAVKLTAQIQKAGGGTGFSFDRLRPTGDYIASSGGSTSGPISFWRVLCEATRAIQQGAFRRGANMGMMSVDHPDILKFVTAKNDPNQFENFNISVKVTDAFMDALRSEPDGPHVVVNPRTGSRHYLPREIDVETYSIRGLPPAESAPAVPVQTRSDIWRLILEGAWRTGDPGLCFIDRVNRDNPTPHLGRIEATNPCGEQPLLDYEACNLGSIDLSKFVRRGRLDEEALTERIRLGVRFLDDVIEVNNYIDPQIEQRCRANRKIGLGIMGLADAMFLLGIKYDTEAGLDFGRRVSKLLTEQAFAAGEALAAQRGSFENWPGSRWDITWHRRMRNAAVTTIAPTGTLSILAGCSGGIEPVFNLAFYRHILGGQELFEVNEPFRQVLQQRGLDAERIGREVAEGRPLGEIPGLDDDLAELFVTAHRIDPRWHLRMQAVFQENVDGAISKTINLPHAATPDQIGAMYRKAYELGCKGVTVYRDGCRSDQPMSVKGGARLCPQCRWPVGELTGCARCPHCGCMLCS